MVKMSHKFKMEKDEFIEKIIKLNNKIESLEQTIKELEENAKFQPVESHARENIMKEEN
jgi:hypothetical protein